jgi:hypothetical protein
VNLLARFDEVMGGWRKVFPQQRTFERARRLTLGLLVSVRLHLTSHAICATGRQFVDWTADYRVFSRSPWDPKRLFDPIFARLPQLLPSPQAPVLLALDDTLCHKSSARIPGVSMGRDPMSPPFHVNLIYGIRFVQASLLVTSPQEPGPARGLPVRFDFAPPAKKPRQTHSQKKTQTEAETTAHAPRDTPADNAALSAPDPKAAPAPSAAEPDEKKQAWDAKLEAYKQEKKERRLTVAGKQAIHSVRQSLDERAGTRERTLIVMGDGSYTVREVVRNLPERTIYIGRIRKDAKLHYALEASAGKAAGRPRQYGALAPTPEQILRDDSIETVKVRCFAAGQWHETAAKVLRNVYWRNAGCDLPLQVVVIKPLGYRLRKGSKLLYRKAAFPICTGPNLELQELVQDYIYRWEIECNHRDEKSLLGVAQGQVSNPKAVQRLPQLQVASYSLLLLTALLTSGFQRTDEYLPLPKWRRPSARPSLLDMLNLLRSQIFARGAETPVVNIDDFASAATPKALKAPKFGLAPETISTVAA